MSETWAQKCVDALERGDTEVVVARAEYADMKAKFAPKPNPDAPVYTPPEWAGLFPGFNAGLRVVVSDE